MPHRELGGQLQDRAIRGVPVEGTLRITTGRGRRASTTDGTPYTLVEPHYEVIGPDGEPIDGLLLSPRIAPAVFGVGLLEGVPEDDILDLADPDDEDGDGISGRANLVPDPTTPRRARCSDASAGRRPSRASRSRTPAPSPATSASRRRLRPDQPCTRLQAECISAPDGGDPELDDHKLDQVTFYTRTLAVPARRDVGTPDTDAGQETFEEIGCALVPRRRAAHRRQRHRRARPSR